MATTVIMPALGMAQESGILTRWLKEEGDQVAEGEPLMVVETDKASEELEAPASGVLAGVSAASGDEIPVGQVIAWIVAPGESVPETAPRSSVTPPTDIIQPAPRPTTSTSDGRSVSPVASRIAAEHRVDLAQVPSESDRISKADVLAYVASSQKDKPARHELSVDLHDASTTLIPASPKARRLAQERRLDLAAISGSGPGGAVLVADVDAAAVGMPGTETERPAMTLGTTWRLMAQRITESWTSVPHFYLVREVEASRFVDWHERAQSRVEAKLTYTDLLVRLVSRALQAHPRVNASWQDDTIVLNEDINVGLAVAVEEGLVVPVIHQADRLNLGQIASRRLELIGRAHESKLRLRDIQGGTFTISNLGMYGVDAFNAIVNPPQAAILAVGRIADRVVPVDGQPAVRPTLLLSMSFDHRVVDGARGAQFLQLLTQWIEDPLGMLD